MTDLIKRDDAPEQIFASQGDDGWRWPRASKFPEQGPHQNIKYIRADLVDPAAIREAALNTKLAKALAALQLISQMHGYTSRQLSDIARAVLAELEGK